MRVTKQVIDLACDEQVPSRRRDILLNTARWIERKYNCFEVFFIAVKGKQESRLLTLSNWASEDAFINAALLRRS